MRSARPTPGSIRVLVVDDSALIRQMLTRALSMDPRIEIVGSAKDGVEAIEKAKDLDPDVITLDIEMPELTGLEALPHIRKCTRARVVMLSSQDDPEVTYTALASGAVDFVAKPSTMAGSITEITDTVLKKIKTAYRIDPDRAAAVAASPAVLSSGAEGTARDSTANSACDDPTALVCIASSTGGPPALERLFSGLTSSMDAAYLIVQHLPAGFAESLARRLSTTCDVRIGIAADGETVRSGRGYVAPHGKHLMLDSREGRTIMRLVDEDPIHGVRPAADKLMESAARMCGRRSIAVVLTGMGSDGAAGALAIKEAGGEAIVQDEETSIVWGMPGAAFRGGAATRTVSLTHMPAEVRRAVRSLSGNGA